MKAIPFDTLAHANKLITAGFTKQQAEAIAEVINENVATKRDLEEIRKDLLFELKQVENRMTIKFGTMIAAAIAICIYALPASQ